MTPILVTTTTGSIISPGPVLDSALAVLLTVVVVLEVCGVVVVVVAPVVVLAF